MPHLMLRSKVAEKKAPDNALYRSRIEICRVLHALVSASCPIYAEFGEGKLFVTTILLVDEHDGVLVVEYGAEKSTNGALFDQPAFKFGASYLGMHLVFKLSRPADTLLNDKPAIKFAIPRSLIRSQRREHPRRVVPPLSSLCCVANDANGELFEARIIDVSMDGIGGMICDEGVMLQVGTVLKGCRITFSGGEPIVVDLVVRNTKIIARSDGTLYKRAGLRFIQRPDEIWALISMFIYDLD